VDKFKRLTEHKRTEKDRRNGDKEGNQQEVSSASRCENPEIQDVGYCSGQNRQTNDCSDCFDTWNFKTKWLINVNGKRS